MIANNLCSPPPTLRAPWPRRQSAARRKPPLRSCVLAPLRSRPEARNSGTTKTANRSAGSGYYANFYYEGWRVVEEHDGSDAIQRQYVYGNYLDEVWTIDNRSGGNTVASLNDGTGNQRHFYHCNTLYHVYGITDEGTIAPTPGALIEAYQYDAYGKQTVINDGNDGDTVVNFNGNDVRTVGGASTVNNPYMYTGQRFDADDLTPKN